MLLVLLYENGLRADAVLLATGDRRMRVVLRSSNDVTELRLYKDQWLSEEGDAVDIESILAQGAGCPQPGACVNAA